MGVERENFIIYGIKGSYDTFGTEDYGEDIADFKHSVLAFTDFKEYRNESFDWRDFISVCVNDGMNGEYSIFGLLVFGLAHK